jgi:hypothetical protein
VSGARCQVSGHRLWVPSRFAHHVSHLTPDPFFREVIQLPDCKSGVAKQNWK